MIISEGITVTVVLPVALEVLLYGIFIVLFSLSIYLFQQKFAPGRLYIIATVFFFLLATVSIILDLFLTCYTWGSAYSAAATVQAVLESLFLIAGIFSDVMLIHRCYRLWNSRKRVIILPILGVLGCFIFWLVTIIERGASGAFEGIALADSLRVVIMIYIFATMVQNLYLSGMIAGRIWWLNRRFKKLFASRRGQNFLGPILESALLTPIFLFAWLFLNLSIVGLADDGLEIIRPCTLTQVVGIASTMIIVRIGLGIDVLATSQPYSTIGDVEVPAAGPMDHPEQSCIQTATANTDNIQPFELKYEDHEMQAAGPTAIEYHLEQTCMLAGTTHTNNVLSIQPFELKYELPIEAQAFP
ncbi:hypothetical protein C8R41DRAFT_857950 [Lentinula lateritia]|uniref:Uncharacterized protein n=1 Tax=Lentinula lateritia TaxID=40482 RepID=A0ABQ8UY82_9AGAR|nr:hypothetical protein C8R41DRAFT_857950 [Lentinula lateritia]